MYQEATLRISKNTENGLYPRSRSFDSAISSDITWNGREDAKCVYILVLTPDYPRPSAMVVALSPV